MAINAGKKFENDFKNSVNADEIFLHRFKDGTTGTVNGQMIRFKNKNLCDFFTFQGRLACPC